MRSRRARGPLQKRERCYIIWFRSALTYSDTRTGAKQLLLECMYALADRPLTSYLVILTYHGAVATTGVNRSHPRIQSTTEQKPRSQPEPTGINHPTRSQMEITGGNWRQPELPTQKPRSQPEPTGTNHPTRSQMEIAGGNWRQPELIPSGPGANQSQPESPIQPRVRWRQPEATGGTRN